MWTGPFEDPGRSLFHLPAAVMLQGVVVAAETFQVAGLGRTAKVRIEGVVDIAPAWISVATGESTSAVADSQELP